MSNTENYRDTYVFPAVCFKENGRMWVRFEDLACISGSRDGEEPTIENALDNAKEALAGHLIAMIDDGDPIPEPTPWIRSTRREEYWFLWKFRCHCTGRNGRASWLEQMLLSRNG